MVFKSREMKLQTLHQRGCWCATSTCLLPPWLQQRMAWVSFFCLNRRRSETSFGPVQNRRDDKFGRVTVCLSLSFLFFWCEFMGKENLEKANLGGRNRQKVQSTIQQHGSYYHPAAMRLEPLEPRSQPFLLSNQSTPTSSRDWDVSLIRRPLQAGTHRPRCSLFQCACVETTYGPVRTLRAKYPAFGTWKILDSTYFQ